MATTKSDCTLILSGGLDSTVLLYDLVARGLTPRCLSFDYGQRHARELQAAELVATHLHTLEWELVNLRTLSEHLAAGCLSGREEVPEGHYAAETMKRTIVPNRNMIMLAIAAGNAVADGIPTLYYAAHAGDHYIYPDCRPEFISAMNSALQAGNEGAVVLAAPFTNMTKTDIVQLGAKRHVPFSVTWSCYKGGAVHCGKCGTCTERREAFAQGGVPDPTTYES